MKKIKLNLDKKLFLNKETISPLNNEEQQNVLGGAPPTLYNTCKTTCNQASCVGGPYTTCNTKNPTVCTQ